MPTALSPASPILRMVIIASAQPTEPSRHSVTARPASRIPSPPGRTIITTPRKPTSTARPRRQPTFSFSSGTDSTVRNSGMVKPSAVTVAIGRCT